MKRIIFLLSFILFAASCEKLIEWDIDNGSLPFLVVEGKITNEKKSHIVILTRPVNVLNQPPVPASNAIVAITDNDNVYFLIEFPAGSGIYRTSPSVRGVFGKQYTLYIQFQNSIFTAKAYMVPVTPLKPLKISESPEQNNLFTIDFQKSDEPSMIEYYLDWSHLQEYDTLYDGSSRAKLVQYTFNSIDANEMFKPDQETIFFPAGTIILRKKYSLTKEYQEFLRTFLSETEWRGGIFDVLPANVITNLSDGAVGYFAASTVVSDIMIFYP
ncbi:MAG: DUF4249 domain-containing protein [Bacteroidales bacterium]|nr:DUF4249 domain-containing protein [Bacteroidales bacterium]